MFEDPEIRQEKKIRKVGRNGAYAIGGGIGLGFLNALYPYEDSARHIATLFGNVALVLFLYGVVVLGAVVFKRKWARSINALMVWLILPALLIYFFSDSWSSSGAAEAIP